jgi:hypothetical protein
MRFNLVFKGLKAKGYGGVGLGYGKGLVNAAVNVRFP